MSKADILGEQGGHPDDEARQVADAQRQAGKVFGEAAEMLPHRQCRRHDHRNL